jgi:hypothetical protein
MAPGVAPELHSLGWTMPSRQDPAPAASATEQRAVPLEGITAAALTHSEHGDGIEADGPAQSVIPRKEAR